MLIYVGSAQANNITVVSGGEESFSAIRDDIENRVNEAGVIAKKLVVVIGKNALRDELKKVDDTPILSTYIRAKDFYEAISAQPILKSREISVIFSDLNPALYFKLANILAPHSRKLVPITASSSVTYFNFDTFSSNGISIRNFSTGDTPAMLEIMDRNDVLIAFSDESLFNNFTIKPIIASLYRRKKIMIGDSHELTKFGALASINTTKELYFDQLIKSLNLYIKNGRAVGVVYSENYDISTNKTMGKSLGFYAEDIDEKNLRKKVEGNEY